MRIQKRDDSIKRERVHRFPAVRMYTVGWMTFSMMKVDSSNIFINIYF
jgi:hypothetical protein